MNSQRKLVTLCAPLEHISSNGVARDVGGRSAYSKMSHLDSTMLCLLPHHYSNGQEVLPKGELGRCAVSAGHLLNAHPDSSHPVVWE